MAPDERAQVGEAYFRGCYWFAVAAALGMCVVAACVAVVDRGPSSGSSLAAVGALAAAEILASYTARNRTRCYEALRGRAHVLAAPAVLAVALAWIWPVVDQNALYFAVAGPIAMIVCVGQNARDGLSAIALIAAATAAAAAFDRADPALSALPQEATATFGVLLSGMLLKIVVQWSATVTQEAAHAPEPSTANLPSAESAARLESPRDASSTRRGPLSILTAAVAEELVLWRNAIVQLLRSDYARSRAFRVLIGFPARELQVLLLLHRYTNAEVARYLSISVSTVRKTADHARARGLDASGRPVSSEKYTRADLSRELAERYTAAVDVEQLARDVDDTMGQHADPRE
jgi:DNA-binding CsgD family transcriptional regulator